MSQILCMYYDPGRLWAPMHIPFFLAGTPHAYLFGDLKWRSAGKKYGGMVGKNKHKNMGGSW